MKNRQSSNANSPPVANGSRQMISAEEFSTMLGVSKRTLWRLLSGKHIPEPLRIGGSVRWLREKVEQWIDSGCPGGDGRFHS
jgi:prophage regulatory protein